ncbi:Galanin-like peptide [Bienertia sinuspersici]
MGNLSSSCLNIQNSSNSNNLAKLVDSQGQLSLVNLPTTVAELMLENPGFALTPVEELRKTHRLSAMRADEWLLGRKLYLLVPVDKVNSRLTDSQLAAIDSVFCSSNKKMDRKTRGGSKVSPSIGDQKLEDLVKDLSGKNTGVTGQRRSFCKASWEPVLEPIMEGC